MSKFLTKLFELIWGPKQVQAEPVTIPDIVYTVQRFLNDIYALTEESGWDVDKWTMTDMADLMAILTRLGEQTSAIRKEEGEE